MLQSQETLPLSQPNGLYRNKRLLFGVNMATDKFQHIIWQILKDCPGTHNIHDDIRVAGRSEEEHDKRLNKVIKRLEEKWFDTKLRQVPDRCKQHGITLETC